MEDFYKGVLSTLSFFIIVVMLFSGDLRDSDPPRPSDAPSTPAIKSVQFEQAPAVVNIGEAGHENKFNWKN